MKTIFLYKTTTQCENSSTKLRRSFFLWPWLQGLFSKLKTIVKNKLHVLRGILVFLGAWIASLSKSKRFYAGLALVVIGLMLKHLYQAFDPAIRGQLVYYQNYHWFFWTIKSQLKEIFCALGIFVAFPTKNKFRWMASLFMFDACAEIIHYTFYTVSDETFHMPFNWTVQVVGYLIPLVLLMIADFSIWAYNHRFRAFESRFQSLYDICDDLPADKFRSMFKTAWRQKQEFKQDF